MFEIPFQINEYHLIEQLHTFDGATFYKAKNHRFPDIDFIIKILPTSIPDSKTRYMNEIYTLCKLDHPNIARIYNKFMTDDYLCIVFESWKSTIASTFSNELSDKVEQTGFNTKFDLKNTKPNNDKNSPSNSPLDQQTTINKFSHGFTTGNSKNSNNGSSLYPASYPTGYSGIIHSVSKNNSMKAFKKLKRISKNIAVQIFSGIEYLHQKGICHRNISLHNIVIDNNGRVKLIGFDYAILISEFQQNPFGHIGTTEFTAPEILMNIAKKPIFSHDIWSLGVVLFYLSAGKSPWPLTTTESEKISCIRAGKVVVSSETDSTMHFIIHKMIVVNPEQRVSIDSVIQFYINYYASQSDPLTPSNLTKSGNNSYTRFKSLSRSGSIHSCMMRPFNSKYASSNSLRMRKPI
ncbi:hypothetical protein TRFO_37009 [Tritrichomonas foetus]|uniref:Protein kinase domain-containing protein n=1 Tax=Tritrichomonas foetus TaxID=1144522 RepID=A0A1J4JH04_9EUKA|nr:hypothetical protein TRFO_37009 [Tritrichomonas foetus]|eukprot:OHS96757.1 hypothetical protein TRFO_37009 [Tritrichomonas foetus]